jgi:hypothetical protein
MCVQRCRQILRVWASLERFGLEEQQSNEIRSQQSWSYARSTWNLEGCQHDQESWTRLYIQSQTVTVVACR